MMLNNLLGDLITDQWIMAERGNIDDDDDDD